MKQSEIGNARKNDLFALNINYGLDKTSIAELAIVLLESNIIKGIEHNITPKQLTKHLSFTFNVNILDIQSRLRDARKRNPENNLIRRRICGKY